MLVFIPEKIIRRKGWSMVYHLSNSRTYSDGENVVIFTTIPIRLPVRGWVEGKRIAKEIKVFGGKITVNKGTREIVIRPKGRLISLIIDDDLYEILNKVAEEGGYTMSELIRYELSKYVERYSREVDDLVERKYGIKRDHEYIR